MIEICPAILTSNYQEFLRELRLYQQKSKQVDIDVNIKGDQFEGIVTVEVEKIIEAIKGLYVNGVYGIHLMLDNPLPSITKLTNAIREDIFIFYVHQESAIAQIVNKLEDSNQKKRFGVVLNPDSKLNDIDFYNQFSEVQLMTVHPGQQGSPFISEVLNRAEWLRDNGFEGKISVDGGVNLETAELIKSHSIDRVSVGSFFSKSENFGDDFEKLNNALNI